ncbi:MAG: F0F1 ATP synthase subunit gamma [Mollicutes bacterium PWAP]|nr:F0F1 ATP synthase subunit gamma [Mollicutes bacterium PWAP]
MASLQETKNRLNSVKSTRKITKAMQLVSTAKIQRAKANYQSVKEYYENVYEIFSDLIANVNDLEKLFPKNFEDKNLYIVITSDLGLCGGYNSNVIKKLKESVKKQDIIFVIGSKGVSSLTSQEFKLEKSFKYIGDEPNYFFANELGKEAIAKFISGEIKSIKIIYTKFINSVNFEATDLMLLPIDKKVIDKKENSNSSITEFEPSADEVLLGILPLYLSALIYGTMSESKLSEMSSRRMAMENASDNADELINTLNLEYNRKRQAKITQEITEIVAGAEN